MSSTSALASRPTRRPDPTGRPDPAPEVGAPPAEPGRSWVLRVALFALVGYVLVAVTMLGWSLWEAHQGLNELDRLQAESGPKELLDGSAADRIEAAGSRFDRAERLAGSPVTAPLQVLPVLGRQVRAIGAMAGAAEDVTDVAATGVEESADLAAEGLPTGAERVEVLRRLGDVTDRAAARLAVIDLGPDEALIGPIGAAHDGFAEDKVDLEETLIDARDAARGMAQVFAGPSSYLLLAANNAEMRAGAGMALSAGLLTFEDGQVELGDMEPTAELQLPGGVPDYDATFAELWGFANPDEEWRNLLLSPRYPASASLGHDMWEALGRPPVDGVLTVDIAALRALLEALGPVDVGGRRIDADNVVRLLEHDQYVGVTSDEQAARRDQLGDVARAVVDRLDTSSPDLAGLVSGLRGAASGRNLLLWSDERGLQRAWEAIGVGGVLRRDDLMVGVLNEGGNKLDQFLRVEAELVPGADRGGRLEIEVANEVPPGEPRYVAGAANADPDGYGIYSGYLAAALPEGTVATVAEGPSLTLGGPDGASQFVAARMAIRPGERVRWVLDLEVPDGLEAVRVVPSARLPGVRWTVGDRQWRDDRWRTRRVEW